MPINIDFLHFKLEQGYNKLSNNHQKYLTDVEKDEVLNTAIFEYLEIFIHGRNPKNFNIVFEVTQQRIDMLHTLVVSYPEFPKQGLTLLDDKVFYYEFPQDYRSYRSARVFENGCDIAYDVNIEQHGDLATARRSFHRRTSKRFQYIIGTIRNNRLYLYPEDELSPSKLELTYIRKPSKVCKGTYPSLENRNAANPPLQLKQDCDLPEEYVDIIVSIAVQELARRFSDGNTKNIQTDKLINLT
jgi:hypothetical protein